jgi:RAD50-interacting protein 1
MLILYFAMCKNDFSFIFHYFPVTTAKMDDIFKFDSPFHLIDPISVEEIKIPKCSDQFIRLLDGIKERYCCLPQPGHQ